MASSELAATLQFLTDAGHLLSAAAPETSAYLMSRRSELMFEHEMPPTDRQRQQVCTCCGHIMLLGQGSNLHIKATKPMGKKQPLTRGPKAKAANSPGPQPASGPTKMITCGYCARKTEIKLPAPATVSRRKIKVEKITKPSGPATTSSLPNTVQETPSQKTSSNASSKKRAKSRKAGLQALLDQSNARSSKPGLGLSLADFMEK
jgi:hypothetical protein